MVECEIQTQKFEFRRLVVFTSCFGRQVEEQAAPLQQRDMFDATPLYYASFTGNLEMIEYLLAKGAKCERKVSIGQQV